MHPIPLQERERKGEVEDPGIEIGILRKQKRSVHRAEVPSRCKTTSQKHHLRAPLRYIIHTWYTYKRYLRISIYVPQSFFFNTHLLTTANLYLTIKYTSTTYPKSNSTPIPRIQYLPTWYIVQTTLPSYTGPHTYQYYILIYTGVGQSAGR